MEKQFKAGDTIILDNVCEVICKWRNDTLMQVEYKDLTRRLLLISDYKITVVKNNV